ncbi:MAG: transcriptional regulator [Flavobacteriaceae bacterium]|nr:transcriptional regulator [Flavobacteriaceae bacterium]
MQYEYWLKNLGFAIATARKQRGWSQREASKRCGLHVKFYRDIEYGRRNISTRTLFRIVEGLGLPQPYSGVVGFISAEVENDEQ